ncbi:hypothetical protein [Legionella sp. km772]|uniref:tetratricopeptide repeat protein n=1 Tax=Legionella sp. km772 TaxID=2498111 RepID=UPI000F8E0854|nr:hypothetical protein [Legionella sp. km772]RUR13291.1 hypothetical protein ELY15_02855 [Legionella sp. km772]
MSDGGLMGVLVALTLSAGIFFVYPLGIKKVAASLFSLILAALILGAYLSWGGLAQWQTYRHQQESQQQAQQMLKSIKSPDELIRKLRAKLDDTPKSAKGWYLLGRLYNSQNKSKLSLNAFAKAHQFEPENEQYTVNYAHALWQQNNQQFSPEIVAIFNQLLSKNPNQPDALAMLAMKEYMSQEYKLAINYWQKLLKLVPPQSQEALAIHKAIAKAQGQIK